LEASLKNVKEGGDKKTEEQKKRKRSRSRSRERRRSRSRERRRHTKSRSRSPRKKTPREIEREKEREKIREREKRDEERQKEREMEASLTPAERETIQADRDDRTVFVTNMPMRAYEDDIEKWFTSAGKIRDIRLITDKDSRKSKGFGYVEFYDKHSVPTALAMSGRQMMGQTVSVQPTQAEKNRTHASALTTTYFGGPTRLYIGSLNFNLTEEDVREVFAPHGQIDFIDLHKDPETGRSKGFGYVQFRRADDAKRALSKTSNLEIAGRPVKVGLVNDGAVGPLGKGEDEDGIVKMDPVSRVVLMSKLQRGEKIGPDQAPKKVSPSPCILLTNMFNPSEETEPNWDFDIKEDVSAECQKYGTVLHCYVDKRSEGHVFLKFGSVPAAQNAINSLNGRWFARKQIEASFVNEKDYYSRFPEAKNK